MRIKDNSRLREWLINEKTKDVISGCGRVRRMFNAVYIDRDTLEVLQNNDEFEGSPILVKTRLQRAVVL